MRRSFAFLFALAAYALATAVPAHAQLFGIMPVEEKEKDEYVADASGIPAQTALICYVTIAVGEEHPEVRYHQPELTKPLLAALGKRVDEEIKRSGQQGDVISAASPLRQQVLKAWDLGNYFKMRDQCETAADAGLLKLRSTPGGQDAINCLGYLRNRAADDPETAFLAFDVRAAMVRDKAYFSMANRLLEGSQAEFAAALAGAQAAQLDATFKGCAPKVRAGIRAIAFGTPPNIVYSDTRLVDQMSLDTHNDVASKIPVEKSLGRDFWRVPAAGWAKLVGSVDAGNALVCAHVHPLRGEIPKGAMAAVDLLHKFLADAGLSPADATVVIAAALSDHAVYASTDGVEAACKLWGPATAKRFGAAWFDGADIKY